jgi:hypothetical protein
VKPDRRLAPLAAEHPENAGVLAYLARDGGGARAPIARPSAVPDPYQGCGSHPDIVERVWDDLGRNCPRAARALVFGTPALVHPTAGIVAAAALGTQYALRLARARLAEADRRGLRSVHTYATSRVTLDLATFGPCWRFGGWLAEERGWLGEAWAELEPEAHG